MHGIKKETQERWRGVISEIESVDKEWTAVPCEDRKPLLRRLLVLSHELSYLSKLQSLIDELIVAVS